VGCRPPGAPITDMSIDAHHHFWNLAREPQLWMTPEHAPIARTFEPADLEPLLRENGVEQTVLVQAACTDTDTDAMLAQAAENEWIGAVVAWIELRSLDAARRRLDELSREPKVRGVRHLIHDEPDPHWILQPVVLESLALLEERGLVLELPCVFPRHLGDVPVLAERLPGLAIVIDHLGKPPLGTDSMAEWTALLGAAAACPNVHAKISGLGTQLAHDDWSVDDLLEPVAVAVDCFGAARLLCGSDWPVSLLNGDYSQVWQHTVGAVCRLAPCDADRILRGTAVELYRLAPESGSTTTRPEGHVGSSAH
jgi:L-fucono-1,5-lactonase